MTTEDTSRVDGYRGARGIYWHRELPPVDAELIGEDVLEATRRST
jgi:hypothetical protein